MDESSVVSASHVVVPSFLAPDFSKIGVGFDPTNIATVFFAIIFLWWALHSLFAVYHWVRYGRTSWFAFPVVVGYLFVSARILFFITDSLR